ncbi:OB-fold domain-containing protein [Streptosporangium sp. NPDC051022]|uniref:Zn-ribbon domain-containing OB-fold protein n=1 Tax=Streptosporangium sp. NPDC051022 TaxID=3155752 RepID=UPI0034332773
MTTLERPIPDLATSDQNEYWRATADRRLLHRRCSACSAPLPLVRRHCHHCGSRELGWRESAGRGTVYTYTVIRRHPHPYFRGRTPYVLAYVDLDEGPRMLAEIEADPGSVTIGHRVELAWAEAGEINVPIFRLRDVDEEES